MRIGRSGLRGRARRLSTRRAGLVLVYHRIGDPAGEPRFELVPAVSTRLFEAHVDHLRSHYRVVAPSRLLEAALSRRSGYRFPIALTFDDDLASHLEVVAPALLRRALPAAFFLNGASLERAHSFWWEDLQTAVDRRPELPRRLHSLPELDLAAAVQRTPGAIHCVAERIERLPPERRDAVSAELREIAGRPRGGLSADAIQTLAAEGFEIGFHTRRHYLLSTLEHDELGVALQDGRQRLESVVGRKLKMIAYPHGKADSRIAGAARAAGYQRGFTGSPVPAGPMTDALMIGRIEPPFGSMSEFGRAIATTLAIDSR